MASAACQGGDWPTVAITVVLLIFAAYFFWLLFHSWPE
jgi:hypothetical protein